MRTIAPQSNLILLARLVCTAKNSLSAPGGIGRDEAITPEPGKRNNWTMVSARLWYRKGEDSRDDRLEINTKVLGWAEARSA
jgi:hypothetical protein